MLCYIFVVLWCYVMLYCYVILFELLCDVVVCCYVILLVIDQVIVVKLQAALVCKRNDLIEKHDDALSLKEGIDRRRHQVAGYLQKCLSEDELKDYEYFIKMKAQLVIDQQEVEDKIEMGQRQLDLLRSTLNSDFDSTSGVYFGPKSYC